MKGKKKTIKHRSITKKKSQVSKTSTKRKKKILPSQIKKPDTSQINEPEDSIPQAVEKELTFAEVKKELEDKG